MVGVAGWGDHLDPQVEVGVVERMAQCRGEAGNFPPLTKEEVPPWKEVEGLAEYWMGGTDHIPLN